VLEFSVACMCVNVHVHVRVCVCACVRGCVYVRVCVSDRRKARDKGGMGVELTRVEWV